ncbi:unnamed protein product [Tilletia controversa]|nr:unnamed protein product [Tilletia controversa]
MSSEGEVEAGVEAGSASAQPEDSGSQAPPKKKAKTAKKVEKRDSSARQERAVAAALAKYRGWSARDIVINNVGYGAILQALKKEYGLEYKEGRFSEEEADAVRDQVDRYMKKMRIDADQLDIILYGPRTKENREAMSELVLDATTALNGTRPNPAVREFIQRQYREGTHQGAWSKEEVRILTAAVQKLGNRWTEIADEVGRSGEDCRSKWELIKLQETRAEVPNKTGRWSDADTKTLLDTVKRLSQELGVKVDISKKHSQTVGFWDAVTQEADVQRDAAQCRIKYFKMLRKEAGIPERKSQSQGKRWNPVDRLVLIDRIIAQLQQNSKESDIDWTKLSRGSWEWAPWFLAKKWDYIKRRFKAQIPKGPFKKQLEGMRWRVLVSKNKYVFRAKKRGSLSGEEAAAESAQTSSSDLDSDESEETTPPPPPQRPVIRPKAKGQGDATANATATSSASASTPSAASPPQRNSKVLGKRARNDSSGGGSSSDSSADSSSEDSSSESDSEGEAVKHLPPAKKAALEGKAKVKKALAKSLLGSKSKAKPSSSSSSSLSSSSDSGSGSDDGSSSDGSLSSNSSSSSDDDSSSSSDEDGDEE